MKTDNIKSLHFYSESRESLFPTFSLIADLFEQVSIYEINGKIIKKDILSDNQINVLKILGMNNEDYWSC